MSGARKRRCPVDSLVESKYLIRHVYGLRNLTRTTFHRPLACGFHHCDRLCHGDACGSCRATCGKPRKLWCVTSAFLSEFLRNSSRLPVCLHSTPARFRVTPLLLVMSPNRAALSSLSPAHAVASVSQYPAAGLSPAHPDVRVASN